MRGMHITLKIFELFLGHSQIIYSIYYALSVITYHFFSDVILERPLPNTINSRNPNSSAFRFWTVLVSVNITGFQARSVAFGLTAF